MFSPNERTPLDTLTSLALGIIAGIITTVLWTSELNVLGLGSTNGIPGSSLSIWIASFPIVVTFLVVTSIIMIALNHLSDGAFRESKNGVDIFWGTAFIVTLLFAFILHFS